jgi:hypothetical protein
VDNDSGGDQIDSRLHAFFRGEPGTAGHLHLGADFVHCGSCGTALTAHRYYASAHTKSRSVYRCRGEDGGCGRTSIDVTEVDPLLRDFTVERLADPRFTPQRVAMRLARVEKEIAALRSSISYCTERKTRKGLLRYSRRRYRCSRSEARNSLDDYVASLGRKVSDFAAERDVLVTGAAPPDLQAGAVSTLAAQWDGSGTHERRGMLAAALGGDRLVLGQNPDRGPRAAGLRIEVSAATGSGERAADDVTDAVAGENRADEHGTTR